MPIASAHDRADAPDATREAPMDAHPEPASPVFVGGTGRSGTTIVGALIGRRADVALVPFELRFHVDGGGLPDLAAGRVDVEAFARKLRRQWWDRPATATGPRGLGVLITRAQRREAMDRLRAEHATDPWGSCGRFMDDVLTPFREEQGAAVWAEMTPPTARAADALCRMFPSAKVVHMVRDGRDVAASVAKRRWGPDDVRSALRWWADGLLEIARAEREAGPGRMLTLRLEALVGRRREEQYAALVSFLGRGDDGAMRQFFDDEMSLSASHAERWRTDLDAAEQDEVDRLYRIELARLEHEGVRVPPAE